MSITSNRNCRVNHSLLIRPANQYIQMPFILPIPKSSLTYNVILNTLPEAGGWGSYWVYTGLRGAAYRELPASGTVLRIILYVQPINRLFESLMKSFVFYILCCFLINKILGLNFHHPWIYFLCKLHLLPQTLLTKGNLQTILLFPPKKILYSSRLDWENQNN